MNFFTVTQILIILFGFIMTEDRVFAGEICGCVESGAGIVEAWTVFAPTESHFVGE